MAHQNIRLEHSNGDGDEDKAEDYFGVSVVSATDADHEKTDYIDELDRLLSREEDKDTSAGSGENNGLLHLQPPLSPPPILLSPPPAYRDTGDFSSTTTPSGGGAIINTHEIPIQTTGDAGFFSRICGLKSKNLNCVNLHIPLS